MTAEPAMSKEKIEEFVLQVIEQLDGELTTEELLHIVAPPPPPTQAEALVALAYLSSDGRITQDANGKWQKLYS